LIFYIILSMSSAKGPQLFVKPTFSSRKVCKCQIRCVCLETRCLYL